MKINTFDAEKILENRKVQEILKIITDKGPKLSKHLTEEINIYGVKNNSSLGWDFSLNYRVRNKSLPEYDITVFSISAITIEGIWKFFVSSPNNEDLLVENIKDFPHIITELLQTKRVEELLGEIDNLEANSLDKDEKQSDKDDISNSLSKKKNVSWLEFAQTKGVNIERLKGRRLLPYYPRYNENLFKPVAHFAADLKNKDIPTIPISAGNLINIQELIEKGYKFQLLEEGVKIFAPSRKVESRMKKRGRRRPYRLSKVNISNKRG